MGIVTVKRKIFGAISSTLLFVSGCSGGGIGSIVKNSDNYFGCYEYNGFPVLIISSKFVKDVSDKKTTKVRGFLKIRSNDFILTVNSMIINDGKHLDIGESRSGFQYEFKRDAPIPTLLLYDGAGREFELTKTGLACPIGA